MKKIIRQILDDLNVRRSTDAAHRDTPSPSVHKDAPKINQPPIGKLEKEHDDNGGQIHLTQTTPGDVRTRDLNLDTKPQPPVPQDLSNQVLSKNPEQRLRQLDFQAQKDIERLS